MMDTLGDTGTYSFETLDPEAINDFYDCSRDYQWHEDNWVRRKKGKRFAAHSKTCPQNQGSEIVNCQNFEKEAILGA